MTRSSSSFAPSRSNVASAASSSAGRRVLVALAPEGDPEQHPCLRRLVRRTDLLPSVAGPLQATDGSFAVALGELDPAGGDVDRRVECRRPTAADLVRVDDLLELVRRRAGRLQVACRNRDLDLRRQTPQARQRLLGIVERAGDSRDRAVDLPLGQAEQGEARLWVEPELVRRSVRLVCSGEVAEPTADLADLVVPAGRDGALEVVELLASLHRLLLGADQVAAKTHDLGAVDTARSRKAGDVEPVAPPVRHLGPLGGTAVVAEVLARADRDAVDEAGRVRPQLAADGGRGCLVEEGKTLLHLAGLDERAALSDEREHLRVAVAEALAEFVSTAEVLERLGQISPAEHGVHATRERQEPVFRRLGLSLEQALGVGEPALRDRERAAAGVVPGQR